MRIGVISDTHGLLRPEALDALRGSDRIVHAGDVGDRAILDALRAIAPVTAVRGNVDRGELATLLPATATLDAGGVLIYIHHGHDSSRGTPPAGARVVISGHTHAPGIEDAGGVLYLNPGSAGQRRFDLPVTVAILTVDGDGPRARIVPILP
jgi:uncharacterized protein